MSSLEICFRLFWHQRIYDTTLRSRDIAVWWFLWRAEDEERTRNWVFVVGYVASCQCGFSNIWKLQNRKVHLKSTSEKETLPSLPEHLLLPETILSCLSNHPKKLIYFPVLSMNLSPNYFDHIWQIIHWHWYIFLSSVWIWAAGAWDAVHINQAGNFRNFPKTSQPTKQIR